jgi:outer membrane protein assembly factor BamB
VILDGNRVVVAGGTSVRAYDVKKGRLQWSDAAPFAISQLYRDEDTTIATAVTAAGTLRVRVYDTKQGTVLVPDQALPVRGGVFAAGKIFTGDKATIPFEGHTVHPCQVTAYSIATGAQLWLTIQPFPASGPTTSSCSAAVLIADRKRVIIGGAGHFGDEFMAQGYDAETGAFLWEHLSLIGTLASMR